MLYFHVLLFLLWSGRYQYADYFSMAKNENTKQIKLFGPLKNDGALFPCHYTKEQRWDQVPIIRDTSKSSHKVRVQVVHSKCSVKLFQVK